MDCYVEIVKDEGEEVVKRMGPMSRRRAEKVEDGAGINLNWDTYHTRIVEEPVATGRSNRVPHSMGRP